MALFLNPRYFPVFIGDNAVRLVSTNGTIALKGTTGHLAVRLLPLLEAGTTESEVRATFGHREQQKALRVLSLLRNRGIVTDKTPTPDTRDRLKSYLSSIGDELPTIADIARKRIALVGRGAVADAASDILVQADIIPHLVSLHGTSASELQENDANALESVRHALANADLILFCPDTPFDPNHDIVNRVALDTNVSWIRGVACQDWSIVGPAVIPSETACFQCYLHRAKRDLPGDVEFEAATSGFAEDFQRARRFCEPNPIASIITGSMLAWEAIRLLTAPEKSVVLGAVWSFNLLSMRVRIQRILRYPRCPVCGVANLPAPNPWDFPDLSDVGEVEIR